MRQQGSDCCTTNGERFSILTAKHPSTRLMFANLALRQFMNDCMYVSHTSVQNWNLLLVDVNWSCLKCGVPIHFCTVEHSGNQFNYWME